MTYQTASREYFDSVIKAMEHEGFELLAWVTMNSGKNRYHVNLFKFAQESRLFFHAPNKSILVMLELIEHFGLDRSFYDQKEGKDKWIEDYYEGYWRGDIIFAHNRGKMRREYHNKIHQETGEWPEFEEQPFRIEDFFENSPFYRHGGGGDGHTWHISFKPNSIWEKQSELPKADDITLPFGKMLRALEGYLYPKFREMQVTGFAPYYTFPDQEEDF